MLLAQQAKNKTELSPLKMHFVGPLQGAFRGGFAPADHATRSAPCSALLRASPCSSVCWVGSGQRCWLASQAPTRAARAHRGTHDEHTQGGNGPCTDAATRAGGTEFARQHRNAERALKESAAVNFETLFAELSERVAHWELQFQMWN